MYKDLRDFCQKHAGDIIAITIIYSIVASIAVGIYYAFTYKSFKKTEEEFNNAVKYMEDRKKIYDLDDEDDFDEFNK